MSLRKEAEKAIQLAQEAALQATSSAHKSEAAQRLGVEGANAAAEAAAHAERASQDAQRQLHVVRQIERRVSVVKPPHVHAAQVDELAKDIDQFVRECESLVGKATESCERAKTCTFLLQSILLVDCFFQICRGCKI